MSRAENREPPKRMWTRVRSTSAAAVGVIALAASPAVARGISRPHHHPHRQSLSGSPRRAHVKVIRVLIAGGKGGGGDPGDDYPARWRNRPMDSVVDQWREYNRECTSFAAWALYSRNGFIMPFNDNANKWGPDAAKRGYRVNATPAVSSIAWSSAGTYGHVAYVVAVATGSVTIEEYNHNYTGKYDKRSVPASSFTGYIHFKDIRAVPAPPKPTPAPTPTPTTPTPTPTPTTPTPTTPTPTTPTPTTPTPTTPTPTTPTPTTPTTYVEHAGPDGATTFLSYVHESGVGPRVGDYQAIRVTCRVQGLAVSDGNPWYYRIASSPWKNTYYASADPFYNEPGVSSGSLHGTPFVDTSVPTC
jgi:surface antigen